MHPPAINYRHLPEPIAVHGVSTRIFIKIRMMPSWEGHNQNSVENKISHFRLKSVIIKKNILPIVISVDFDLDFGYEASCWSLDSSFCATREQGE